MLPAAGPACVSIRKALQTRYASLLEGINGDKTVVFIWEITELTALLSGVTSKRQAK